MTAGRLFVMHEMRSRALGALYGLAIGDALGMPAQSLPRTEVVARYGALVGGFPPGPPGHPLAAGLPAGSVTDDTEQAVLLARLVVAGGGEVDAGNLARDLLAWEESMRARGTLDLLGPSTRQALAALAAGADVAEAGGAGLPHGAAPRGAPGGRAPPPPPPRPPGGPRARGRPPAPHTPGAGGRAAPRRRAARGGGVGGGRGGGPRPAAISRAAAAAASAAGRGHWVAGADVAARIIWATGLVTGLGRSQLIDTVYRLVGTGLATQESVPAAFAVAAACPSHPWLACRIAASLGGDCDTIAAMTGAICGACHGAGGFPDAARQTVAQVNHLDFGPLADDLLAIRTGVDD